MAHRTLNRSIEGRSATRAVRVSRSSLRCHALNVTHQAAGPPPAWDRRVVVPEVEPRDTPKVIIIAEVMHAVQLSVAACAGRQISSVQPHFADAAPWVASPQVLLCVTLRDSTHDGSC